MATQTIPVPTQSTPAPAAMAMAPAPRLTALQSLRYHWPEYGMEGALLACFMIAACLFGALLEFPGSPVRQAIDNPMLRRVLMGMAMGLTAIAIIYSPWGKQSGAHINPSVTLTFLRLGKIKFWDALFYIASQFIGAVVGVLLVATVFGRAISDPAVRYVVTVPGAEGPLVAVITEFFLAAIMMMTVLYLTSHHKLSPLAGVFAGALVALFISVWSPLSGMSINPARTFGSAMPSGVWDGFWVYVTGPPLGMLIAAEIFLFREGRLRLKCCKLHHDNDKRCIFCGANGGFPNLVSIEGSKTK